MTSAQEWYENFRKNVKNKAKEIEGELDISQDALYLKNVVAERFEDNDRYYTFSANGKFGFSESLVNQMIEHAIMYGASRTYSKKVAESHSFLRGKEEGYSECRQKLKEIFGFLDD